MSKTCSTCVYNRRCPIQRADDAINCRPRYYVNSMWRITTHPSSFEEMRKGYE